MKLECAKVVPEEGHMNAWELNNALMTHCPYPDDQAIPMSMAVFNKTTNSYGYKDIYQCDSGEHLVAHSPAIIFIDKKSSSRWKKVLTVGDVRKKIVKARDSGRALFLQDYDSGPGSLWPVKGFGLTLTEEGKIKSVFITDY